MARVAPNYARLQIWHQEVWAIFVSTDVARQVAKKVGTLVLGDSEERSCHIGCVDEGEAIIMGNGLFVQ